MKVYHNQELPELTNLLGEDVCTFAMLSRIVRGKCVKTVTDHQRVIMCLSVAPYPVWVWTAPDASKEELEGVWQTLKTEFPPEEYAYNVSLPLARVMMESDPTLCVTVGLMAYHCKKVIVPRKAPGGSVSLAKADEADLAIEWYRAMHKECALNEDIPLGSARKAVMDYIYRDALYFWRDEAGKPKAMCGVDEDEAAAYISHVYTPPRERRKGYAANLVHAVSSSQLEQGRTPMLYTDANYAASNACYTQIGFELQGELRTVRRK